MDTVTLPRGEDTLIVSKTNDGYRVYSHLRPADQFVVRDTGDDITCTCPDFERYGYNPDWRCQHIGAVLEILNGGQSSSPSPPASNRTQASMPMQANAATSSPKSECASRCESTDPAANYGAWVVIKRSISPDRRIDSLSIEWTLRADETSLEALRACAAPPMALQEKIVADFLEKNPVEPSSGNGSGPDGLPAKALDIGGMDGRWGRRLFLNVQVNSQTLKLFGSQKQLAEALSDAGLNVPQETVAEGVKFNFNCRAITKPNGQYTNVDKLLPAVSRRRGAA